MCVRDFSNFSILTSEELLVDGYELIPVESDDDDSYEITLDRGEVNYRFIDPGEDLLADEMMDSLIVANMRERFEEVYNSLSEERANNPNVRGVLL